MQKWTKDKISSHNSTETSSQTMIKSMSRIKNPCKLKWISCLKRNSKIAPSMKKLSKVNIYLKRNPRTSRNLK